MCIKAKRIYSGRVNTAKTLHNVGRIERAVNPFKVTWNLNNTNR